MSGMDGYALPAALREIPHLERTPSIALSGYGAEPQAKPQAPWGLRFFYRNPFRWKDSWKP